MIVDDKDITVNGRLIKVASLKEEWDDNVNDPDKFVGRFKQSHLKADIFTFMQNLPESNPKFEYFMEWDSVAAIPILTHENWLKKQIAKNSRKKIKLCERKGVVVKRIPFNDDLVRGILDIYHESAILQGTPNKQYNTDFETAKRLNSTYLNRAVFIGAYYKSELIAYLKLVSSHKFMRTMGILTKFAHREKGAMNLLISKAVEVCAESNYDYLTFAKYNYGKRGSTTLKTYKKNMGFESIILPRYYVPMTKWGSLILKIRMHREPVEYLPIPVIKKLILLRTFYYTNKYRAQRYLSK